MLKNTTDTQETVTENHAKKSFEQPKLTYIKPKLNKQGKVTQITQSFFGSFSP